MKLAPTWTKAAKSISLSGLYPKPNRSPAKRVRFGEEEQRNERALTFEKSRRERYDACSNDVAQAPSLDALACRFAPKTKPKPSEEIVVWREAANNISSAVCGLWHQKR